MAHALDSVIRLPTPEHADVALRAAGPLPRLLAWVVDVSWRLVAVILLGIPLLLLGNTGIGVLLLVWFALDWLAGGFIEWRWEGRTPGKKRLLVEASGLRIVKWPV